jgi:hypothetical protein
VSHPVGDLRLAGRRGRADLALLLDHAQQRAPHVGVDGEPLREDLARAAQRLLGRRDAALRDHEGGRIRLLVGEVGVGQRLEPLLTRQGTRRLARRSIGLVEVLQLVAMAAALDAASDLRRHLAALGNGAQDELAPLLRLAYVPRLRKDVPQRVLVQPPHVLAPVSREIGCTAALAHQLQGAGHDAGVELPALGNLGGDSRFKRCGHGVSRRPGPFGGPS